MNTPVIELAEIEEAERQLDADYNRRKAAMMARKTRFTTEIRQEAELTVAVQERLQAEEAQAAALLALQSAVAALETQGVASAMKSAQMHAEALQQALSVLQAAGAQQAIIYSRLQTMAVEIGATAKANRLAFTSEAQRQEWCRTQIDRLLVPVAQAMTPQMPASIRDHYTLRSYLSNQALAVLYQLANRA